REHDVANVHTKTLEIWIERVTDRDTTDDSGSGECKQECGRHVVRREILASLLFRQHIQIPPERHPLFIVVKKVPDARRRGSVGAKKLCFLRLLGNSQDKIHRDYFKPSFFPAASRRIASRMRLSCVSGRLAI